MTRSTRLKTNQHGVVLIMFALILVLIGTAAVLNHAGGISFKAIKERKTAEALAKAKAVLIGWSVAHSEYPGTLPFPDRNADTYGYDGKSDCVTSFSKYEHLIGKLPYVGPTSPCVGSSSFGLSENLLDGDGERLWYAVSRNLIRHSKEGNVIINPSIGDAPLYPWLIVRDQGGNIISNRVAAVIIAPGLPLGTQNRSGGLQGPAAYLDSIMVNGTVYSNADYSRSGEDFIAASTQAWLQTFNDKLVYITIDELMYALEGRALAEMARFLRNGYKSSSINPSGRYFPFAAAMGDVSHTCQDDFLSGSVAASCTKPALVLGNLPIWFVGSDWLNYIEYTVPADCSYKISGCASGFPTLEIQGRTLKVIP